MPSWLMIDDSKTCHFRRRSLAFSSFVDRRSSNFFRQTTRSRIFLRQSRLRPDPGTGGGSRAFTTVLVWSISKRADISPRYPASTKRLGLVVAWEQIEEVTTP